MTADIDCPDDCCTYPAVVLDLSHRHRDTLLIRDSLYTNNLGQRYRINSVGMLFSDFRLVLVGDTLQQRETVVIGSSTSRTVRNDHFFASTRDFRYTAATIAGAGDISQLLFTFGSSHVPADTTLADDDYRLRSGLPRLAVDTEQYAALDIILDSLQTDTLAIWRVGGSYPLQFDIEGELLAGSDLTVVLDIDYAVLLDDVDLLADSTTVASAIGNKIDEAFTVRR